MRALLVVLSVREYAEVHAQLVRAPRSTDRPSERATTQALRARLRECDGDRDVDGDDDDDLSRTVHVRRNDADVQKGLPACAARRSGERLCGEGVARIGSRHFA